MKVHIISSEDGVEKVFGSEKKARKYLSEDLNAEQRDSKFFWYEKNSEDEEPMYWLNKFKVLR